MYFSLKIRIIVFGFAVTMEHYIKFGILKFSNYKRGS